MHKAFQTVASVGPAAFFLRRILNQARHHLLEADPADAKVSAIAKGFGITELGRFSVRYRQMFDESASETLRRFEGQAGE